MIIFLVNPLAVIITMQRCCHHCSEPAALTRLAPQRSADLWHAHYLGAQITWCNCQAFHMQRWRMQVLAVIFDILVSHRSMARWHQERIAQHVQDAAELADRREQVAQRLASHEQASSSHPGHKGNNSGPSKLGPQSSNVSQQKDTAGQQASSKTKSSAPEQMHSSSSLSGPAANGPGRPEGQGRAEQPSGPGATAPSGAAKKAALVPADVGSRPRHKSSKSDGDLAFHALENGHALSRTRSHDHLPGPPAEVAVSPWALIFQPPQSESQRIQWLICQSGQSREKSMQWLIFAFQRGATRGKMAARPVWYFVVLCALHALAFLGCSSLNGRVSHDTSAKLLSAGCQGCVCRCCSSKVSMREAAANCLLCSMSVPVWQSISRFSSV